MKVVHDCLGEMELKVPPERVVSLAPSVTDALFYLGMGARVVGRSAFCWRPPEAEKLPVVSSYTKVRWDLLEALEPDLVFTTTAVQRDANQEFRERGYNVWPVPLPNTPWGIIENLGVVAAFMGVDASELQAALAARYLRQRNRFLGLTYYFEFDLGGPITIGRASYVAAALAHLGMKNVLDRPEAYFPPPGPPPADVDLFIYEPKRIKNREAQLAAARGRAEELGLSGVPLVVTGGDELAHFGPLFFDYFEAFADQVARAAGR